MQNKRSGIPFQAIPASISFLKGLKEIIEKFTEGQPGKAVVIFPGHRPSRYFYNLYRQKNKAVLLPKTMAYSDLPSLWVSHIRGGAILANRLDLISLAWESVKKAEGQDILLAKRFAAMSFNQFFPWGMRLASLFEEIAENGSTPENIDYTQGIVSEIAQALLASLGIIGKYWNSGLKEHNWTTPGYDAYLASKNFQHIPELLIPDENRFVFIAGFSWLNSVQNKLFHSLWEAGAIVCNPVPGGFFSEEFETYCKGQKKWQRDWNAKLENAFDAPDREFEEIKFFAGYDLHSQLMEVNKIMEQGLSSSAAIVLANPDALLPLLHGFSEKEINISMGYPIKNTQFYNFVLEILMLIKNRRPDKGFYWADVIRLLRQPFLKSLQKSEESENIESVLQKLEEKVLVKGKVYVNLKDLSEELGSMEKQDDFAEKILEIVPYKFLQIATTEDLGNAFNELINFCFKHAPKIWKLYPLDAEAMVRLQNTVIPQLLCNDISNYELDLNNLEAIFTDLAGSEKIPFEADPINGIQVIGFEDITLLSFDDLIMIDACEDLLPGKISPDPLAPEELRPALNLPLNNIREQQAGYNFYRALSPAKKAWLLWQEGGIKSELFDNKKQKSRFVEQLIWKREKEQGSLLKYGEDGYNNASAQLNLQRREDSFLTANQQLEKKMQTILSGKISSKLLNQYFKCPLNFAFSRLLKLSAPASINEGDDSAYIGIKVHDIIKELYDKRLNKVLSSFNINWKDELNKILEKTDLDPDKLPLSSRLMLEVALEKRLGSCIEKQALDTIITGIEKEYETDIQLDADTYDCYAKMDRIDERDGKLYVLDYKTGKVIIPSSDFWKDEELFKKLENYCNDPESENGEELQQKLYKNISSIQLPFYLTLLKECEKKDIGGAQYVDLYESGTEKSIFNHKDINIETVLDKSQLIIRFLLAKMKNDKKFIGSGNGCEYCGYALICNSR